MEEDEIKSSNVFLWRVTQYECRGYDTYDSAIVAACNAIDAQRIHPSNGLKIWGRDWASSPDHVEVELIGVACGDIKSGTVVLASFNAG